MTATASPLDDYIEASARALSLPMEAAWKEPVRANMETIFKLAALVEGFELPDDIEPAPAFEA
jgi:Protein of unknown function (DUF4089)